MVNVTFYIDKNNADKKGFSPIKANVSVNYKNVTKKVEKIKAQYWNKTKQRVNKPKPHEPDNNYKKINEHLDKFQNEAKEYFKGCENKNIEITPQLVKDYFKGKKLTVTDITFWEAYEQYLKIGELELSYNTNRNRKTIYNKIKEFETNTNYKLTWDSVNLDFWDRLKEFILNNPDPEINYSYNYLSAIADKFRAFMKWSLKRKYHNNIDFMEFSAPEKEISHISLTWEELQHLLNFEFENKKLSRVRDFFCFGCLTGQRYSDISKLTKDNIVNNTLKITQQKTNKVISIPIYPGLEKIIHRYEKQYRLLPKYSNAKLNKYLKECLQVAEINTPVEWKTFVKNETRKEYFPKYEKVGSHTARKTFICLAYERGMDIEMIKSITGITQEKTLRRYLDISDKTKRDKLSNIF